MNTSLPPALGVSPRDAGPSDVSSILTRLGAFTALPIDQWDAAHAEQVQQLSGWLQCAARWRAEDSRPLLAAPARSSAGVVHELLNAYQTMLARQRAETAPFKAPDGTLLGEDYDDHDEVFDRHVGEQVQTLDTVMAILTGEFGRPIGGSRPAPEPQGWPAASPRGFAPPVSRER